MATMGKRISLISNAANGTLSGTIYNSERIQKHGQNTLEETLGNDSEHAFTNEPKTNSTHNSENTLTNDSKNMFANDPKQVLRRKPE